VEPHTNLPLSLKRFAVGRKAKRTQPAKILELSFFLTAARDKYAARTALMGA